MIAVVLDRRRARFFDVSNASVHELKGLRSRATGSRRYHFDRADSPGGGERAFHNRRLEEQRRHYERVAARLAELTVVPDGKRIVLAGPGPTAGALRLALPDALARRVVGTGHLNPTTITKKAIHAFAMEASEHQAAQDEAGLITMIEEGVGTGRATNGTRETLRALARRAVRTLVVRADQRASGFRCADSERLVLSAVDCHGEGTPLPVSDVIAAAMQTARAQGATLTIIHDPALAKRVDGLAALLRFPEGV